MRYLVQRPSVLAGVVWDGGNFAEVADLLATLPVVDGLPSVTDNGDGTLTLATAMMGTMVVADGWWVVIDQGAATMMDPAQVSAVYAEVSGSPPFAYDVTGA